jgi:hypothetical protein
MVSLGRSVCDNAASTASSPSKIGLRSSLSVSSNYRYYIYVISRIMYDNIVRYYLKHKTNYCQAIVVIESIDNGSVLGLVMYEMSLHTIATTNNTLSI